MQAKSLQSCPTLCDPMDCSPPGSSVHGDSPGKNTGGGCDALLQGIFPTQGSNPHLFMFPALAGGFFTNSCHLGSPLEEVTSKLRPQVNRKGREFPREKEHIQGLGVRQHVCDWLCLGQKTGGQGWDKAVQRGGWRNCHLTCSGVSPWAVHYIHVFYFIPLGLYLLIPFYCLAFPPTDNCLLVLSIYVFVLLYSFFLDSTYKWKHTIFVILSLPYFTKYNILQVLPCCWNDKILFLFNGWVIFPLYVCMYVCIYIGYTYSSPNSFICWWTLRLLLYPGYCK